MNSRGLAEHVGITYRQLDYWAKKGWLGRKSAPGSGSDRNFTPDEVARAVIMAELIKHLGMKPYAASQLAARFVAKPHVTLAVGPFLLSRPTQEEGT